MVCRTACENKDPVSKTDRFGKVMGDKDRCFFSFFNNLPDIITDHI